MSKLELALDGDNHIIVTRTFKAPAEFVYRAHIEPALIQQWMLGPEGYTMPVCISEPKPGGKIRYEWARSGKPGFYLTGEYIALEPYTSIEHVERMHLPEPTPDNHVQTTFVEKNAATTITIRMSLPSKEVRAMLLSSGMDQGMEVSYRRLDAMASGVATI